MKHDAIMDIARDAAGGMLSYDAEGFCSLTGPEILRFAEMLVKQCAAVAGYYYTRNECVSPTQIKEHFGVE